MNSSTNVKNTDTFEMFNYDTVQYTMGMKTGKIHECKPSEFEAICKVKNNFEMITDDVPVKLYFDCDHKFKIREGDVPHADKYYDCYDLKSADYVLQMHKKYITGICMELVGFPPRFGVAESHYASRMIDGVEHWAYSWHIVVNNILAFKPQIHTIAVALNNFVKNDQLQSYSAVVGCDKYNNYMIEGINELCDLAVYKSGKQKMRCLHSSKDGENRPFKLVEGTFQDLCITSFIPTDAVISNPPVEVDTSVATERKHVDITDAKRREDADCVSLCFQKGIFHQDSSSDSKWRNMGFFLKGYFGDTEESYALFDAFSSMGGASYTPSFNRDIWDGFATNAKYDNFGIFINWAKKDNKVLCKEVLDELKVLKSNAKKSGIKSVKLTETNIGGDKLELYNSFIEFDLLTDIGAVMYLIKEHPTKFLWIKDKLEEKGQLYSWTGVRWELGYNEFVRFLSITGVQLLENIRDRARLELMPTNDVLDRIECTIHSALKNFRSRVSQLKIIESSQAFLTSRCLTMILSNTQWE